MCKKHKTYQGKRVPRTRCETCWHIYLAKKFGVHASTQSPK